METGASNVPARMRLANTYFIFFPFNLGIVVDAKVDANVFFAKEAAKPLMQDGSAPDDITNPRRIARRYRSAG